MPTLDTLTDDAPVHLLLIGDTKAGKSTYVAEAAIAGFTIAYIDFDNGLSALLARIKQEPNAAEIMQRVNYFAPKNPVTFVREFLKSSTKAPLVWLPDEGKRLAGGARAVTAEAAKSPEKSVWIINATAMPKQMILSLDSWTTLAADALGVMGPDQNSPLLDGSTDQSVYGEAKANMMYISNMLQRFHTHVIVQAHSTRYEIWEKPKGSSGAMKQREMTLVETVMVPISSSRQHGLEMGSRFNHIGILEVGNTGMAEIDFTRRPKWVSGGPPNRKAKTKELGFAQLTTNFSLDTAENKWYAESTLGAYAEALTTKA